MTIDLYFQNMKLGNLSFDSVNFIYNSNIEGEKLFSKFPSYDLYGLEDSIDLKSEKLFDVFRIMLDNLKKRHDILYDANALDEKDDFNILYKFACLPQDNFKFWLKAVQ